MFRLNDAYFTFQGEGLNMGRRALFVRVPFCNLTCSWCDTEFNSHHEVSEEKFRSLASSEETFFAVITGGEPSMNKQTASIARLLREICYADIAIETNGMFKIPAGISFVTVSPKRDGQYYISEDALSKMNEMKLVVDKDFDFATCYKMERLVDATGRAPTLWLSPEYNDLQLNTKRILVFLQDHPRWRLNLQTHKFVGAK